MRAGDVVTVKRLDARGVRFKADDGEVMVMLCIGVGPEDKVPPADQLLNAMGWTFNPSPDSAVPNQESEHGQK